MMITHLNEPRPREGVPLGLPRLGAYLGHGTAAGDLRRVAEQAREAERLRLARELHDTVAQEFLGILLHLRIALKTGSDAPGPALAAVRAALDLAQAGLDDTRRAVGTLRAAPVQTTDLVASLKRLTRGGGPGVRFDTELATCRVTGARAEHLLRIAAEALTNARRHAWASVVVVSLAQECGTARLAVADDGVGFAPTDPTPGHYGLVGMIERAAEAECQLTIRSQPGRGTTVEIRWPAEAG